MSPQPDSMTQYREISLYPNFNIVFILLVSADKGGIIQLIVGQQPRLLTLLILGGGKYEKIFKTYSLFYPSGWSYKC